MKTRKEDLGKGIRALLDGIDEELLKTPDISANNAVADHSLRISLEAIEINPFQPRTEFNEENLNELAASIRIHGVIQPITVRSLGNGRYQLIAGERRLRASKMAGAKDVPAYIRKAGDQEMLEIALIENIHREDLNAVEIAINYKRLQDECNLTQEELSTRLGKNRSTVTNYLRLLKLPPDVQMGLKENKISMGHARAIIGIPDPVAQLAVFKETVEKEYSVRKVEQVARSFNKPSKKQKPKNPELLPPAYQKIQDELSSLLGSKVRIRRSKGESGEIVISFYSEDDLDRILDMLG